MVRSGRSWFLAALLGLLLPAVSLAQAPKAVPPPSTTLGRFEGSWYYADPGYKIAIFIGRDRTGVMKIRYQLRSRSGLAFKTDEAGFARFLDEETPIELLLTGSPNKEGTLIEGRYERIARSGENEQMESSNFRIYRTSKGENLVLHYPELTISATDASGRTSESVQTDLFRIFQKASEIVVEFEELPF
jgi:hypothetical protein